MSEEQKTEPVDQKAKKAKAPKPPKKVKRGTVIYEPERSVHKTNIFRDRLISFSVNVNIVLSLMLLASAGMNTWIITQPNSPSPFFIQYTTGQIAPIKLYPKERLPPPMPLDIAPLAPQARLDDLPVYSSTYTETDPVTGLTVPSMPSAGETPANQ